MINSIDDFGIINLASSVGTTSNPSLKTWLYLSNNQIESNAPQDSVALALQVQTLTANIEELTRQNQEVRLQLQ